MMPEVWSGRQIPSFQHRFVRRIACLRAEVELFLGSDVELGRNSGRHAAGACRLAGNINNLLGTTWEVLVRLGRPHDCVVLIVQQDLFVRIMTGPGGWQCKHVGRFLQIYVHMDYGGLPVLLPDWNNMACAGKIYFKFI